jgi:uroporphyrinogen decarboxylase
LINCLFYTPHPSLRDTFSPSVRRDFILLKARIPPKISLFKKEITMTEPPSSRFLKALARQPVDATPIWIMRQAGRYLPEYRALRSKIKDFMTLCKTPDLACEVTLQPLRRFDLDAAIIFSDILTIPDAMGLGLYFEANEGPKFTHPIRSVENVRSLQVPDMSSLAYVSEAIKLVTHELAGRTPLIGFSGSPWTLATYMVEGGGSKQFQIVKRFLYTEPEAFQELLAKLVTAVSLYLQAQIAAGVQAVMIFDTWGGVLNPVAYQQYSLDPMAQIVANIKEKYPTTPIILFTKNGGQWLSQMASSGADALGIDWTTSLQDARARVQDRVALQGNMDPSILYASPERIREEVATVLQSYGQGSGHIFNLGHGIHPDVPPEHVQILVEAVHELSRPYHV